MYGPRKLDRVPNEFIAAIPGAAAVPVKKLAGKVQNSGGSDEIPIWLTQKQAIFSTGSSNNTEIAAPSAVRNDANATCRLRSPVLSEWRVSSSMPAAPKTNGTAVTVPVWNFESPKPLTMVGRKKMTP